jgi:outer membrane protein OmpA-like peptidoglycan-associated protein
MSRTVILLLGLIALALLIFLCVRSDAPAIQKDIQTRSSKALSLAPTNLVNVSVDGRNVILKGATTSDTLRNKATDMAQAVYGVVSVNNHMTVAQVKAKPVKINSPYKSLFTKTASGIVLSGLVPDEQQRKVLLKEAEQEFGAGKVVDQLKIASGAPVGWLPAATVAMTKLALFSDGSAQMTETRINMSGNIVNEEAITLVKEGLQNSLPDNFNVAFDLNVAQAIIEETPSKPLVEDAGSSCAKQFADKLAGQKLYFSTASSRLGAQNQMVINKVLEFSTSCPSSIIEVAGYTDARGSELDNLRLSKKRAKAVVNKLIAKGISADRLKAAGYGEAKPLADNGTKEGQASNRRIEFTYLQEGA